MTIEDNLKQLESKLQEINDPNKNNAAIFFDGDTRVWHKSHRKGSTGIGKTFEDLLGKTEDNLPLPDYLGIELKARNRNGSAKITLFTKSPSGPQGINTLLRNAYGYVKKGERELHTSVTSDLTYNSKSDKYFKIMDDQENKKLSLQVYDSDKNLIEDNINAEWSYSLLEKHIQDKIKTLAIIQTDVKKYNGDTYYSYDHIDVAKNIQLDDLLKALADKKLVVDLRLGVYHSGKNKGKTHDHGTGFRINYNDLKNYNEITTLHK